jgi:hypothetical protein
MSRPLLYRKSLLALGILTVGVLIVTPRQIALSHARQALDKTRAGCADASRQITNLTKELEARRRDIAEQVELRDRARVAAARAESQLATANPDAFWSQPPAHWPDWNINSPYVWLRKEILSQLRVECFSQNGQLRSEIAQVMTIPKDRLDTLNADLNKLVADYAAAEAAKARRVLDTNQSGERTLTIQIDSMADEGQRLADEFGAALLKTVGSQRADFLMESAKALLTRRFSELGKQSRTISVTVKADGSRLIATKYSGWLGMSSIGLPATIPIDSASDYASIPAHLLPLFNELWDSPSADAPQ